MSERPTGQTGEAQPVATLQEIEVQRRRLRDALQGAARAAVAGLTTAADSGDAQARKLLDKLTKGLTKKGKGE